MNRRNGHPEPGGTLPTVGPPFGIVVVDFNHDGHLDIAAATAPPHLAVFLGGGDGSFIVLGGSSIAFGAPRR